MRNRLPFFAHSLAVTFSFLGLIPLLSAETHALTLRQVVDIALKQNPELVISRLDEQKARAQIRIAKDPFVPKLYGGSGLAYTSGYPNSIDGSPPSIFQARTDMALFNRPKSYDVASTRESARGAAFDTANKADDVAYRAASAFLDIQQMEQTVPSLDQEIQALERVSEVTRLRILEGRELPLSGKRTELDLARVRQRKLSFADDVSYAEEALAVSLGFPAGDRIEPVADTSFAPELPESEEQAIEAALRNNKEIRRLESQMQAKGFDIKSQRSQHLPQVDLVAQYALFAQYNYGDFFKKFSRNNGQIGASIKIPILVGAAPSGARSEAELDIAKLRTQINDVRNRSVLEARKSFQDVKRAESARDVAKLDLEVSREQVKVLLDQMDEGRATRQAVDQARLSEQEKWIAFYDSQHLLEKAKINLLRHAGTIQTALR